MAINSQGTSLHVEGSCTKSATHIALSRWDIESQTFPHDVNQERNSMISAKGILSFCFLDLIAAKHKAQPFCEKAVLILWPLIFRQILKNKVR